MPQTDSCKAGTYFLFPGIQEGDTVLRKTGTPVVIRVLEQIRCFWTAKAQKATEIFFSGEH